MKKIMETENYIFGIDEGMGINNTPWKEYAVQVKEKSLAYKYCVEIRFNNNRVDFVGKPVFYEPKSLEVAFHGYTNMENQTVSGYVQTLSQAVCFAELISFWFKNIGKDVPFINK